MGPSMKTATAISGSSGHKHHVCTAILFNTYHLFIILSATSWSEINEHHPTTITIPQQTQHYSQHCNQYHRTTITIPQQKQHYSQHRNQHHRTTITIPQQTQHYSQHRNQHHRTTNAVPVCTSRDLIGHQKIFYSYSTVNILE